MFQSPKIVSINNVFFFMYLSLISTLIENSILIESSIIKVQSVAPRLWSYRNVRNWHLIDPQFSICQTGKLQSPIDIQTQTDSGSFDDGTGSGLSLTFEDIGARTFHSFESQQNSLSSENLKYQHFHQSNTIQIDYQTNTHLQIANDLKVYKLIQSHYHTPSDHSFDGKLTDAEMHLVHQSESGQLAVVGIMLNGEHDEQFAGFDYALSIHDLVLQQIYNFSYSTGTKEYYTYRGSLTTPPCSEGVTFFISTKVLNVPASWLREFTKAINEDEIVKTHRPVQPRNGRVVSVIKSSGVDKTTHQPAAIKVSIQPIKGIHPQVAIFDTFFELIKTNSMGLMLAVSFVVLFYWRQTLKAAVLKGKVD